ncbi:MAG: hypothetical protein NC432_02790 [Roseburia sp.]|nr:hypothetical protein [Roseburia sp.]MCM1097934.1 hypothetical protein [Ruminococcus flavefaciens]
MDIRLFDNDEDDGQLSMFDLGEDVERLQEAPDDRLSGEKELPVSGSAGIRISRCSSCGKMLFVREEEGGYRAVCNACQISYTQRA